MARTLHTRGGVRLWLRLARARRVSTGPDRAPGRLRVTYSPANAPDRAAVPAPAHELAGARPTRAIREPYIPATLTALGCPRAAAAPALAAPTAPSWWLRRRAPGS